MILLKFALLSIKEKKGRTLLIILSLTLTAALFLATTCISGTLGKVFENQYRDNVGKSDFLIYMSKDSKSFLNEKAAYDVEEIDTSIGIISKNGVYKYTPYDQVNLNILGMTIEDYKKLYDLTILDQLEDEDLTRKSIMISAMFSEKFDLNLGDSIDLEIRGSKYKFNIGYIVAPTYRFKPDKNNPNNATILIQKEYLNQIYNMNGKSNMLYLINKDGVESNIVKEKLDATYKNYVIRKSVDIQEIESFLSMFTGMFGLLLLIVIIISVFIIYTSFKVIMYEKLKVIGTFRSIGATKKKTTFILLLESIIYGVIGGVLGFFLGIGILYIMAYFMSYNPWTKDSAEITLVYNNIQILWTIGFAVTLVLIGSLNPVIRVVKIPVKDIILGTTEKMKRNKYLKSKIALVCIILFSMLPFIVPKDFRMISGLSLVLIFFLIAIAMPYLVLKICFLLEPLFERLFGNIGFIAIKNVRENKNIINNITLLTIGIMSLILINGLSFSVAELVSNFYAKMDFEVWMRVSGDNRNTEQLVRSVKGVSDTCTVKTVYSVNTEEVGNISLFGIEPDEYFDFVYNEIDEDIDEVTQLFKEKRCVIVTEVLKDRYKLEKGDYITFETDSGDKMYEIVAFTNAMMNNGTTIYPSLHFIKRDYYLNNMVSYFVRTDPGYEPVDVNDQLKVKFRNRYIDTNTVKELGEMNRQSNDNMFMMFKVFSIVACLIGIVGMFNNFMLNLISRQRIFAVMNSVGLSKKQTKQLVLLEAISVGVIGALVGLIGSVVALQISVILLRVIMGFMEMYYDPNMFMQLFIGAIIVSILGSLIPLRKSTRINIVEAIKYE
ncbi:ABC transporter permease [Vallitalea okinawensis]|uniref:ABC transporter permease n=1 Tax=Vallitalea okinawensis TaxID=2078660 RepID=UPI000CFB5ECC|nr:ABC transporter permease [Vallitalea okinawensis]